MTGTGQRKGAEGTRKKDATGSTPPRTLMEAHNALVAIRPKSNASLEVWKAYYERSVRLYREIAEIDRGHHHESLYWADREQEKVNEITERIRARKSQEPTTDTEKGG